MADFEKGQSFDFKTTRNGKPATKKVKVVAVEKVGRGQRVTYKDSKGEVSTLTGASFRALVS